MNTEVVIDRNEKPTRIFNNGTIKPLLIEPHGRWAKVVVPESVMVNEGEIDCLIAALEAAKREGVEIAAQK